MAQCIAMARGRGQAVVELAMVMPFLMLLVLGGLDVGRAYYFTTSVAGAAREGVRVGSDPTVTTSAIQQAVISAAPELNLSASAITVTTTCSTCYASLTGGSYNPGQAPQTVTVVVVWSFAPVTPGIANLFPNGLATLVGTATGPIL